MLGHLPAARPTAKHAPRQPANAPLDTTWQRMHPGEWALIEISQDSTQQRFLEIGYLMVETASHIKIWLPETVDRHASVHTYRQDTVIGCHFLPQTVLYQLMPMLPYLNKQTGPIRVLAEKLLRKNVDVRTSVAEYLRQYDVELWAKRTVHTLDHAPVYQQLLELVDKSPNRLV
ncbi:hypothetical protein [Spirosoma rhododendri]|uniref:Uncharacterized protein n=1 Tax=Spirosoma rhododendri TaxID=2728024 RepID=A0A7L5DH45_9BACT|nr:hypothetical protein [Spirosoma rhododendri]QJD77616.1 hypothetical protein HH216_03685 [Spirosoma rhododendri]